ncbi:MAG TPA: hypothetical protein VMT22_25155 [Terriglobales bacterium]|jgi:hypothetical protein|nr:hypothetical protein [Terriglobales bacterium]
MRIAGKTRVGVLGLLLLTAAALIVSGDALAASSSIGGSAGGPRAVAGPHPVGPHFPRGGIVAVEGAGESPVVIIQTTAPAPVIAERTEPPVSKTYVQPRWVDGGHGVQVLEPGHWVETTPAAKR